MPVRTYTHTQVSHKYCRFNMQLDVCMKLCIVLPFPHCFVSLFLQTFQATHVTQMFQFLSEQQTRTFYLFRWTQSLHQSDTSQQSSCWHWKGECWIEWDQRCHLIRFIILILQKQKEMIQVKPKYAVKSSEGLIVCFLYSAESQVSYYRSWCSFKWGGISERCLWVNNKGSHNVLHNNSYIHVSY